MKKKSQKSQFSDSSNFFSGSCSDCGEVYQASSKSDDLEGITFRCKKVHCSGRITLAYTSEIQFAFGIDGYGSKPHRVC